MEFTMTHARPQHYTLCNKLLCRFSVNAASKQRVWKKPLTESDDWDHKSDVPAWDTELQSAEHIWSIDPRPPTMHLLVPRLQSSETLDHQTCKTCHSQNISSSHTHTHTHKLAHLSMLGMATHWGLTWVERQVGDTFTASPSIRLINDRWLTVSDWCNLLLCTADDQAMILSRGNIWKKFSTAIKQRNC